MSEMSEEKSSESLTAAKTPELVQIRRTLGLLRSMILSGEPMTDQAEQEIKNALVGLTRLEVTEDLPPDLARVLRDPTIVVPRDHEVRLADGRTLHEHLEEWRNAPSNTASADLEGTP